MAVAIALAAVLALAGCAPAALVPREGRPTGSVWLQGLEQCLAQRGPARPDWCPPEAASGHAR